MLAIVSAGKSAGAVLIVGNLLIVCHELGHYLAARWFGIRVTKFTIGFGPKLYQRIDRLGTVWTLSLLPIGGFVSFGDGTQSGAPGTYAAQRPLVRMIVIAAGPAANVVVAVAIFTAALAWFGQPGFLPIAATVAPGSAAERASFHVGDRILVMDGKTIETFEDMRPGLRSHPGETVRFSVERDGQALDLLATLGAVQVDGKRIGLLGITSTTPYRQMLGPGRLVHQALWKTWSVVNDTVAGIAAAATKGTGTENIAGVVGIAELTSQVADQGLEPYLALIAILSANLALMNLLPVPILDGGALLFCLAEVVLGRAVSARSQDFGMRVGLAVLASLFMMTTIHDLDQAGLFRWLSLR